ncbi:MAG: hypothetical protein LBI34_02300 [Puniceicoccales bacterium]|jgi:hypothetical protein|nr:hypothetical protein [Puniceicoccales bacterium]
MLLFSLRFDEKKTADDFAEKQKMVDDAITARTKMLEGARNDTANAGRSDEDILKIDTATASGKSPKALNDAVKTAEGALKPVKEKAHMSLAAMFALFSTSTGGIAGAVLFFMRVGSSIVAYGTPLAGAVLAGFIAAAYQWYMYPATIEAKSA